MALYQVLRNGVPQVTGAVTQDDKGFAATSSGGSMAVYQVGTSTSAGAYERAVMQFSANFAEIGFENGGGGAARHLRVKGSTGATQVIFAVQGVDRWACIPGGEFQPASSGTNDIGDSTNSIRDLHIDRYLNFIPAASTFGSVATITNGPRAANPVAWVEVKVAGTTGRIPVW